jgi:hypothetical protein
LTAGFISAAKRAEGIGQQCGIPRPFGKARNAHDDFGQAIVQVFAEPPVGDHRFQVLVRGADDARIDLDRATATDPLDRAFLQKRSSFTCSGKGCRPLRRETACRRSPLDLALGGLDRPGEGPFS